MTTLMNRDSYWTNFYMKIFEEVFFKVIEVVIELERDVLVLRSILLK